MVKSKEVKQPAAEKPPTQGVGVSGFKADVYGVDEERIRWDDLIHIPKFQTYAMETSKGRYGHYGNVMHWIKSFIQDQVHVQGELKLFEHYKNWHDQKGYWKNETLYGQLIGD